VVCCALPAVVLSEIFAAPGQRCRFAEYYRLVEFGDCGFGGQEYIIEFPN
jgi:hypothetical protein